MSSYVGNPHPTPPIPVIHPGAHRNGPKRILFAIPHLVPPGGGNGLGARLIDGLLEQRPYSIEIACVSTPRLRQLDEFFGTRLLSRHRVPIIHRAPWHRFHLRETFRAFGLRGAAVEDCLLAQWIMELARSNGPYDLYVSTCNEWSFPDDAPSLTYIHYPRYHPVRGEGELRWFHRIPGTLRIYRYFCRTWNESGAARIHSPDVVANSRWTADRYFEVHRNRVPVVNPPILSRGRSGLEWDARRNEFVLLGRIAPEKRVPHVVAILEAVRRRIDSEAQRPSLHIIGSWDVRGWASRRLRALLHRHSSWIRVSMDLSRNDLDDALATSRYGIHGMENEHFGMAVAELQDAGCVTFVPGSGGPREIIGEEPRQIYDDSADAVTKILHLLGNKPLQRSLHRRALERRQHFTGERFVDEMLGRIDQLLGAAEDGTKNRLAPVTRDG
jgi:glycosyltransferase involved in cell wall biosynthesis